MASDIVRNINKYIQILRKNWMNFFRTAKEYDLESENDIIFTEGVTYARSEIPKAIWMYWDDDLRPELIQASIDRITKLNPTYSVRVLSHSTLKDFLPDLIFDEHIYLPIANKSDIIRLNLLYKYGGIWLDSSVLFFEDLSWLEKIARKKEYDLIGFYNDDSTIDFRYPVIESWFLCTPPNNSFIKAWRDELDLLRQLGSAEYFSRLQKREDYNEIKQRIVRPEYLLIYLAMQIVIRENNQYNFYLRSLLSSAFMYHKESEWNALKVAVNLLIKNAPSRLPPLIKLTSHCRSEINWFIRMHLYNKNSILKKIL